MRSRRWQVAAALGGPLGTLVCALLTSLPLLFIEQETLLGAAFPFWSALAGLASLLASVLILTMLPIPPLDGFHLIAPWLPEKIRDQAFGLGWAPLLLVYILLGQANPLSEAYLQANALLTGWLHLPEWLAAEGLGMLRLR